MELKSQEAAHQITPSPLSPETCTLVLTAVNCECVLFGTSEGLLPLSQECYPLWGLYSHMYIPELITLAAKNPQGDSVYTLAIFELTWFTLRLELCHV